MDDKIKKLVIELGKKLTQRQWKCTVAESCTGGGLGFWITSVPGSSTWFDRGFITYSNQAKQDMLNVKADTLSEFGSVSENTAKEMATGALQHSNAQIAVSITGIAGPDGGSTEKPVGTVWIGITSIQTPAVAIKNLFQGDRQMIRDQSIITALEQLLTSL